MTQKTNVLLNCIVLLTFEVEPQVYGALTLLNHTLLNQETAKPYFAKPYSAKQESGKTHFRNLLNHTLINQLF